MVSVKIKTFLYYIVSGYLLFYIFFTPQICDASKKPEIQSNITILTINDVYNLKGSGELGNIAYLKSLIDRERKKSEGVTFLTLNGDFLGPPPPVSLDYGKFVVNLFDLVGVDFIALGNHEFDYGLEYLTSIIKGSKALWFGSNIKNTQGKLLDEVRDYKIINLNGVKIGIFGTCTTKTKMLSNPGPNVLFEPVIETSEKVVNKLKGKGVDVIIALTHQSLEEDFELARQIQGIDLILGGHDHFPITVERYGTLIHKSGCDATYLGKIDLKISKNNLETKIIPSWQMLPVSKEVRPDNTIIKQLELLSSDNNLKWLKNTIKLSDDLDIKRDNIRTKENSFANVVTDFIRNNLNADCVMLNAGYFRGDFTKQNGENISLEEIVQIIPFTDKIVLVELTGQQLIDCLEYTLSFFPTPSKTFPHVSGVTINYDYRKPFGEKIQSLIIDGKPVVNSKLYKLATLDFLYNGGDGFESLAQGVLLKTEGRQSSALGYQFAKFIENKKQLNLVKDGRINLIN